MIGTIIIAVVGYGLCLICFFGALAALKDAFIATRKNDTKLRREEIGTFLSGSLFTVSFAILTRILTGGQF